jgi:hypothetical protein
MRRLSMHSWCLESFFLLSFGVWGGGGEDFFSFFLCSLYVPFKFPMGSHQVLDMFPKFPIVFPKDVPNSTSLQSHICFAQSPPLLTYIGGPKEDTLHLQIECSIYLGEPL